MAMVMGIMVSLRRLFNAWLLAITILFLTPIEIVSANTLYGFQIGKALTLTQMYSDNLGYGNSQLNSNPQSGFVTIVDPSLFINKQNSRIRLSLSSRYQLIAYEGIDKGARIYPQIQFNSNAELYKDSFYLDASGLVSQGNLSNLGTVSSNNVSVGNSQRNSSTYSSVRVSPYWKIHASDLAIGEARVGYSRFDRGNINGNVSSGLTGTSSANNNSNSYYQTLYLTNGSYFNATGTPWRFNANNQQLTYDQSSTGSVRFTSFNGEIDYYLTSKYSLFVQSGYYLNNYGSGFSTSGGKVNTHNGFYITPGIIWKPVYYFTIAAGWGLNSKFTTINFFPSTNTSLMINFRDSSVGGSNCGNLGLSSSAGSGYNSSAGNSCSTAQGFSGGSSLYNGGGYNSTSSGGSGNFATGPLGIMNAGTYWNVVFSHRRKKTVVSASYITTVTTIQNLLSSLPTFTQSYDQFGNPIDESIALNRNISLPNFTNGVMVINRAQTTYSWMLNRNSFHLNAYYSHIDYSDNRNGQDIYGINSAFQHTINSTSNLNVSAGWNTSASGSSGLNTSNINNDFYMINLGYNKRFSSGLNGMLSYSYFHGSNSQNISSTLGSSYDNNRVYATLSYSF